MGRSDLCLKKGLIASFIVTSITGLSGCDLLGAQEDEEVTQHRHFCHPDLVVPEPLEPISVPAFCFLRGIDYNDPGTSC